MEEKAINTLYDSSNIELTKQGCLIYSGDAFNFHEWAFRTTVKFQATKVEEGWEEGEGLGTNH